MTDLDNFKTMNDKYGHKAGDAVLKRVGEILKLHSRKSEMCGRIGGEEFLFSLCHITEDNVKRVIDRVRSDIEGAKFPFDTKLSVTASFGAAGVEGRHAPAFSELILQADAALYAAKRNGRNHVEFAPRAALSEAGR
jgi:diguanylate cyclase (GGDEF)-like protein